MTTKTINTYDNDGAYVLVADSRTHGPIVLETEGEFSSRVEAQNRSRKLVNWSRVCICRLVPVEGNELLMLDLIRMQPQATEDNAW